MHLTLAPADLEFQAEIRAFIDRHWPRDVRRPRGVASHYRADRSAAEQAWFAALVARGWSVPNWPVAHGGTGWSPTWQYLWDRETALAETPQMDIFGVTMVGPVICRWGSAEQQARFLPPIREARVRWCQGYSEPGAGSDLASLTTRAVREGDGYRVNGAKTWTSGAHVADWMFCLVRTGAADVRPQQGISFLLLDMTAPGVAVRPIHTLGDHHSVNSVTLTDVWVPAAQRIGDENAGWTYAKRLLDHERTGTARVAQTQVQLARLKDLAGTEQAGAGRLADDADFMRKLVEVEVDVAGLEGLELRVLASVQAGQAPGPESSILKLRGTQLGQRVAELFVEAFGYYALPAPDPLLIDNEGPIGHDYALDALQGMLFSRSWSIYGGANEIQKNIIAKQVLGL